MNASKCTHGVQSKHLPQCHGLRTFLPVWGRRAYNHWAFRLWLQRCCWSSPPVRVGWLSHSLVSAGPLFFFIDCGPAVPVNAQSPLWPPSASQRQECKEISAMAWSTGLADSNLAGAVRTGNLPVRSVNVYTMQCKGSPPLCVVCNRFTRHGYNLNCSVDAILAVEEIRPSAIGRGHAMPPSASDAPVKMKGFSWKKRRDLDDDSDEPEPSKKIPKRPIDQA